VLIQYLRSRPVPSIVTSVAMQPAATMVGT
jgi:hypothetical protein